MLIREIKNYTKMRWYDLLFQDIIYFSKLEKSQVLEQL